MADDSRRITGGCYCGRVRYRADNVGAEVTECHCSQCRKQSGHRYAVVDTPASEVAIEGAEHITWFRASPAAERGFCATCGSNLFWRSLSEDDMEILAASVDEPTGLKLTSHIFVEDKGDYYEITDGLAQYISHDTPCSRP